MLIAAAGFAGAGKSTALRHLASIGVGDYHYAGGIVTREVARLGLEAGPQNERRARDDLREKDGMAALAKIAEPDLRARLQVAPRVLIDAICNIEEAEYYRARFGGTLVILALQTKFELRATRLAVRPERPLSVHDLIRRDAYETETLRMDKVLNAADFTIVNDGDIADLETSLARLAKAHLVE
ncbi:AAA family ATPase [Sphingosinicella terrae]|uniref:AAA family ATPase n=1 Tax=Sphingosinicella terrae TaxID=2172047 RepID=UPI000E0D630C|nr:hypothetical protein [Sphingosinicella terrae]